MASKAVLLAEVRTVLSEVDELERGATYEEALKLVAPKHHGAFRRLIDQMETDVEFLAYWEQDENCQKAVMQCVQPRIDATEKLLRKIRALFA